MSLPSLELDWHFRPNRLIGAQATVLATNQTALLDVVSSFVSTTGWVNKSNVGVTPTNMATVYYSSNGTVPGTGTAGDGVNRWSVATDVVWSSAGSPASWMVLFFPALGWYMLFYCGVSGGSSSLLTLIISPNAFTGGTATARPTSTVELVLLNQAAWGASGTTNTSLRFHVMKSTTGMNWRIFGCNGGNTNTMIVLEEASAHNDAWTTPIVGGALGAIAGNVVTVANLNTTATLQGRGLGTSMTFFLSVPHANGTLLTSLITTTNGIDGTYPFIEQNLVSTTASRGGKHGYLKDFWFVPTIIANGTTAPTTPPMGQNQHQFVVFGNTAHPWCETPAIVA